MINALQSIETLIGTVTMPLCANVHPLLTYLYFFVSCLPQSLMLECLDFAPTNGSLYYDEWETLQSEHCQSVLLLSVLVVCKHLISSALWLTDFCAFVLFDCACDMDHESAVNELLYIIIKYKCTVNKEVCKLF